MTLKVLIVDDTILFRKVVGDAVAAIPGMEVVGTAPDGKIALSKIKSLKPDILTLDMEMPGMNGLELLEAIRAEQLGVGAILISCLTVKGGELTMKGLELGAFDFITKPEGLSMEGNITSIKNSLEPLLKAYARKREIRGILRGGEPVPSRPAFQPSPAIPAIPAYATAALAAGKKPEAVAIGISTGGPNALTEVLVALPGRLGVPLFIVQHMPAAFTASLANNLNARCAFRVKEGVHGEKIEADTAYLAPGGKHMRVDLAGDGTCKIIKITEDPPENGCRPAVDYLFRSVAHHYPGRATAVIMTGMGSDGALGLKLMKRNGARVIAQNEATCVVYGMPKAAVDAGVVDALVPLDMIAGEILKSLGKL